MNDNAVVEPNQDMEEYPADKKTVQADAFERLPDEIIEQILQLTTPNVFASLIVLNRKWRTVSQQTHLYAHHLSRCPSFSAAHISTPSPEGDDDLPKLRRLFAREVKRNLFEAYLRPQETIINLVSTSISSSSAPGGEAFHFSLSPRGHYVLAYSSSRIHVLDVTAPKIVVKRELKILRRPASTTITDDGSLLAVLSTDMQVDLYDLTSHPPKHTRAIALDHTPRTIALSPTGSVLAAAYDAGVEVSSLEPDCLSTERRAVKCYAVDSLCFSKDGTQLLGSTIQSRNPSTVVLTAPYYDPGGNLPEESTSALWTTSILFPNGSRDCSHAVLLPSASEEEASWTFTYDRVFETFRAVRIDDLRNGTTYFTGPTAESHSNLLPSTLPAASEAGDLVVAGFQGCIWIYGVPEDLEAIPKLNGASSNVESEVGTPSIQLGRRNSAPSLRSVTRHREGNSRTPQWQLLCDKFRNTFVEGRNIAALDRVSSMNWVTDFSKSYLEERLVAVAPGVGGLPPESEDDSMNPTDGGRISVLDFGYNVINGTKRIITIEVGDTEPEILEEEHRDLDTEVALVRRRTVAQRRENRTQVVRSATTIARPVRPPIPPMPPMPDLSSMNDLSESAASVTRQIIAVPLTDQVETASIDEDDEAFDAPYSQTSPRSGTTLRRAATAAAVNRRLNPRSVAQEHIEYRRADGREEHPHESDADNWVPPPPPYSKEPVPPLPEHIQRSILAEAAAATLQRASTQRTSSFDFPGLDGNTLQRSRTFASVSSASSQTRREYPFPRSRSESTTVTLGTLSPEGESPMPRIPSPVSPNFDDLYDVSPPGSPQSGSRRPSDTTPSAQPEEPSPESTPEQTPAVPVPTHQIARKPVAAALPRVHEPALAEPALSTLPTLVPSMRATIQQPVSPIPQPQQTPEILKRRLMDWETTPDADIPSSPSRGATPPPSGVTKLRMEQALPSRPDERRRVSEHARIVPQQQGEAIEHQPAPVAVSRPTAWQQEETASAPLLVSYKRANEWQEHLAQAPVPTFVNKPNDRERVEPESAPASVPRSSYRLNEWQQEDIVSQPALLTRRSETVPSQPSSRAEDNAPSQLARRAETAPVNAQVPNSAVIPTTHTLVGPSAEQIARLNNRRDRPPSQILADPRRSSVNYSQSSNLVQSRPMSDYAPRSASNPLPIPGGDASTWRSVSGPLPVTGGDASSWNSLQNTPPRMTPDHSGPPRGAAGAHGGSPARSKTTYSPHSNYSHQQQNSYPPPTRRVSLNAPSTGTRLASIPSPNSLRPTMQRLDTIHSATSADPPWPLPGPKSVPVGVNRNPSRAERSAAKNMKDAKKRGWRASMRPEKREKKNKWGDASSAGWTDVSDMRSELGRHEEKERKSGKCAVM